MPVQTLKVVIRMTQSINYRHIMKGVRPPKVVVFTDINSEYWETDCLAIIAMFNRIWGGAYNLIIPTDGETIDKQFWLILAEYDPDYFYFYQTNLLQLLEFDPQQFEVHLDKRFRELGDRILVNKSDYSNNYGFLSSYLLNKFHLSEELKQKIAKRCNPFYTEPKFIAQHLRYEKEIRFPLTDITKILQETDITSAKNLRLDIDCKTTKLLLHSKTGTIDSMLSGDLNEKQIGMEPFSIKEKNDIYRTLNHLYNENRSSLSKKYGFQLCNANIEYYIRKTSTEESDPIFVIGDAITDFYIYYSLSRIRNNVFWVPVNFQYNDIIYEIFNYQRQDLKYSQKNICLFSSSLKEEEIKNKMTDIENKKTFSSEMASYYIEKDISKLLVNLLIAYNTDNHTNEQDLIFDNNRSISSIDTPVPKKFSKIAPTGHYWITDVEVMDTLFPKKHLIGKDLIDTKSLDLHHIRVTKTGVSYFSPHHSYLMEWGDEINYIKVNPHLKLPDTFNIFKKLFSEAGYTIKTSDKGLYAEDFTKKFSDIGNLTRVLRTPSYTVSVK
jgi:hypothetical protein